MTALDEKVRQHAGRPRRRSAQRMGSRVSLILLVAAVAAWVIALPTTRDAPWNTFGLLAAASPLFLISLLVSAIAFSLAIASKALVLAGASLVTSTLMLRLPTALSTEAPLYAWTYKHFGVIDYIQRFGAVDQTVDIYHNWPGAFAIVAWINAITGTDTLFIAQWFAVLSQLALAGAVYFLARSMGSSVDVALTSGFVAQTANWVGQDYLSPQAIAFTLGIVVLALALRSRESRAAPWMAVGIFAAIVVTHQLTPYWLVLAITVLTLLGQVRPRYLFVILGAMAGGYAFLHRSSLASFGDLLRFDFFGNLQTTGQRFALYPSDGLAVSSLLARSVTVTLWLTALAILVYAFFKTREKRRQVLVLATLAFSPVAILLGQGYGGEAVLRVFLYSLPGVAIVVAPVIVRMLQGSVARLRTACRMVAIVALSGVTAASAQAYYGAWFANNVSMSSVELATWLFEENSPDTLTIAVAPGAPGRLVAEYADFARIRYDFDTGIDSWLNTWPGWEGEDFSTPHRMRELTDGLIDEGRPALVIVTEQMYYYTEYYGTLPPGSLDRLVRLMDQDDRWILYEYTDEQLVYRLGPTT